MKLEKSISLTFQDYDQMERELFAAFTNAIRDSHEKQRAQIEYTKYFGLVLSITASFLMFIYGTVKKHDRKVFIEQQIKSLEATNLSLIKVLEKTIAEVIKTGEELNHHVEHINDRSHSNFMDMSATSEKINNLTKSIKGKFLQSTPEENSTSRSINPMPVIRPSGDNKLIYWSVVGIAAVTVIALVAGMSS